MKFEIRTDPNNPGEKRLEIYASLSYDKSTARLCATFPGKEGGYIICEVEDGEVKFNEAGCSQLGLRIKK